MVEITELTEHSPAARAGIRVGDRLVSIGGREIRDVLDYRFYLAETSVTLSLLRGDAPYEVKIEKELYDDIGLGFASPLMDDKQRCSNRCIFCFIDQNPKGLRESLYFKDDDSRLSFLHGNYVTLTNMSDADIDRIIEMRFSPVNVSVHTMNPDLRVEMMHNKNAGRVLEYLPRLAAAGITLHCQIVLCRGINDGRELDLTMERLAALAPAIDSVSVVPAGMTAYRDGLYPLTPYTKREAKGVIRQVERFAKKCRRKLGARIFFCADELYLLAERRLPRERDYEGYPQIENGVGMLRSLVCEVKEALADAPRRRGRRVTVATGVAAAPTLRLLCREAERRVKGLSAEVVEIQNDFFGHSITVSGLLTGRDLLAQLSGRELGDALLIPASTLRAGEDVFLCGMTLSELSSSLGIPVIPVANDGGALVSALVEC
jgi:putative radical SAM enzyme (TIGR03279 family)